MAKGVVELRPRVTRLLSVEQIERMQNAALRILEETGYSVPEGIRSDLLRHMGVTLKGERVCFAVRLAQEYVDSVRAEARRAPHSNADDRILLIAGAYAEYLLDPDTDHIRPVLTRDVIRSAKMIDSLYGEGVRGSVMGMPSDVPVPLRGLAHYMLTAEFNQHNEARVTMTDALTVDLLYEMHQVMSKPFDFSLYAVSPLSLGGVEFDVALGLIRGGKPCSFGVGSMPMAGATAPIHLVGAFVQGMADVIGGAMILKLLAPEAQVSFGVGANHFDMRSGGVVYGSPEDNLTSLMVMDINEYYRGVRTGKHFCRTMAKRPGLQAASEMAASAMLGALAGAPFFGGAGILSLDEVYSEEQLALTIEVRDYVQRVARGLEFSQDTLAVEEVMDAVERGEGFLAREATVARHREVCWGPRFFTRGTYAQAPTEDDAALRARLRAFLNERIARHRYQLDEPRRRELERIWQAALRRV